MNFTLKDGAFKGSLTPLINQLALLSGKQLRGMLQQTLNDTAGFGRVAALNEMKREFNKPTPYIVPGEFKPYESGRRGAIEIESYYRRQTPLEKLTVTIGLKDSAAGGVPASKILAAEVDGGFRRQKRSEKALATRLSQLGYTKAAIQFYLPGSGAKLDQYGNISGPRIVSILSSLKAFPEAGYTANRTAASAARRAAAKRPRPVVEYGIARGRRGTGNYYIYEKKRGQRATKPILVFIDSPHYKPRINPNARITEAMDANFGPQFKRVLDYRLRAFR